MSYNGFGRRFGILTHIIMLMLLCCSVLVYKNLCTSASADILSSYSSYPYMIEHILCGMVIYLVFSVAIAAIHRRSMHDGSNSCQK